MAKINPQYQKMITQIKIDADNFADQQMQTVYKNQKNHLTEIHKYLGLLFIGYAIDGKLKVTPYQKSNILVDLNLKLTDMAKDMGNTEVNQVTEILKKNFSDTYYKNAYIMDSGMKINLKFDILKKEFIDTAVNNPVDGELFSNRIWANKAVVADKVKQGIVDAMNGNVTIDKLGKDIQHTFNVGAYESQRLVNTENARVQGQAIDDIGRNTGCTQQMYCATLEHNTCGECAELDGQYFDIDDESKPDIPQHPNCRCLYINVPPIGWEPTVRKDNESKDIVSYEDYNKWLKDKGIDNIGNNDIIKINNQLFKTNKSLGAMAKRFYVKTDTSIRGGEFFIKEGTYVNGIKVIAHGDKIREVDRLINKYKLQNGELTKASDWYKVRGTAVITDGGIERKTEIHWYQCKNIGKVEFKEKIWGDNNED